MAKAKTNSKNSSKKKKTVNRVKTDLDVESVSRNKDGTLSFQVKGTVTVKPKDRNNTYKLENQVVGSKLDLNKL